jgi:predicted Fe-Mo cluster-binding NifX family protein
MLRERIQYQKNKIMQKKIAIPLENGQLCSHFGHCEQFAILETENNQITTEIFITPPPHEPGLLPAWIAEKGVTDVIAGGIGQKAIVLFNEQKINVFVGAPVKSPKELVIDFLNNKLDVGANYCDH